MKKNTEVLISYLILIILSVLLLQGCGGGNSTGGQIPEPLYLLNDTGIYRYSDTYLPPADGSSGYRLDNEPVEYPGQDASYGRDVMYNNDSDGIRGFSFTKIANDGSALANQTNPYSTQPWSCVQDNVTGLIWEVKTKSKSGHRGGEHTYTWYNTDPTTNGGFAGYIGFRDDYYGPSCGSPLLCNTQSYTLEVNNSNLCGRSNWRLPTLEELRSLLDYSYYSSLIASGHVKIDLKYFPHTHESGYWTSSLRADFSADTAFSLGFWNGRPSVTHKSNFNGEIRLVSDGEK